MQAYEGMVDWLHSFLTSARDETDVELYVATALPRERGPGTICVEGWVGSRPNLDAWRGDKFLAHAGTRTKNPRQSQTQPRPILNYCDSF